MMQHLWQRLEFWLPPQRAFLVAGGISAVLLIAAHLFERIGGLAPCLLCLDQREVHWVALGVAVTGGLIGLVRPRLELAMVGLALLTLTFFYSTWLSGFHAGVEWDFWDGPPGCAVGGDVIVDFNPEDIFNSLETAGPTGPPCEQAAWRLFGLSMAGYNALISLGLALFSAAALWRVVETRYRAHLRVRSNSDD